MTTQSKLQVAGLSPQEIISVSNHQLQTTSLIVADVFGKRHSHILEKIRTLDCSSEFRSANFSAHPYTNPQNGETYQQFEMTKDGFMFLVMGFTGKQAAGMKEAYINAFNWMADRLAQQHQSPQQKRLGVPWLSDASLKEINRIARSLCNRNYTHYRNRLISEAVKEFDTPAEQIERLAEHVWQQEQQGTYIDGVHIETYKQAYML